MAAAKHKATPKKPQCVLPDNKDLYMPPLLPAEKSTDTIYHMKLSKEILAGAINNALHGEAAQDLFHVTFNENEDGQMHIGEKEYDFAVNELPTEKHSMQCVLSSQKENVQVNGRIHYNMQVDRRPNEEKSPKSAPRRRPNTAPTKRTAKDMNDSNTPTVSKTPAPKRSRTSTGYANARAPLRSSAPRAVTSSLSGMPTSGTAGNGLTGLRSTPSPHLSPGAAAPLRQPIVMSSMTRGFNNSRSVTPPGGPSNRGTPNGNGRTRPSPGPSPAQSSAPSSPGVGNLRPRSTNSKELRVNIMHILALGDMTEAKLRTRLFENGPDRESENVLRKTLSEVATLGKTGYSLLEDKWREVDDKFPAYSQMERSRVSKAVAERAAQMGKKSTPLRSRPPTKSASKSELRSTVPKSEPRVPKSEPRAPKLEGRASSSSRLDSKPSRSEPRGSGSRSEGRGSSSKGLLPQVSKRSSDDEMMGALVAFDNRIRKSSPIRSEAEDDQAREYWVPLHALYSEVNRRLEKIRDDMEELGNSYYKASAGPEKRGFEKQIMAMYKKCGRMQKEYVRQLPKLHKEVKKTLERIEEWVEYNKEESL